MGFCYEDAPGTPREDIVNQVVDDWNRRSLPPSMREAVEALERANALTSANGRTFDELISDVTMANGSVRKALNIVRSLTGAKP
jgi:hypothetical protein